MEKTNFSFCHFNANALQRNQIKETENEKISWDRLYDKTSDKKEQQQTCNVITYYIQKVHWVTIEIKSHIRAKRFVKVAPSKDVIKKTSFSPKYSKEERHKELEEGEQEKGGNNISFFTK